MTVPSIDPPIYDLRGVTRSYGRNDTKVHAVRDVTLRIERGEFVAIVGPSGSGKTTLLQLLGGLDRPTSGEVRFEGRDLASLKESELTQLRLRTIGFVFQQFNLIPTVTAAQNVELALAPTGRRGVDRREWIQGLLGAVGLAGRGHHLPSQLSGGEQQRVAIVRALANDPKILLADEPTGNLDHTTAASVMDTLIEIVRAQGLAALIATHNLELAGRLDRIVALEDGRLHAAI
jgi:ABC-type lipoprotein export system ATPase subunit